MFRLLLLFLFTLLALTPTLPPSYLSAEEPQTEWHENDSFFPIFVPHGDAEKGKEAFEAIGCAACHSVAGHEFEATDKNDDVPILSNPNWENPLGWIIHSIISPSHSMRAGLAERDQETIHKMPNLTDHMTVRQLIDIIEFLKSADLEKK